MTQVPNLYFLVPVLVGGAIQSLKILIDFARTGRFRVQQLRTAGGFPSVHAGLSSSVATLVLLVEGRDSMLLAVVVAFSIMIFYDAMNVRYEAGRHALYLNHLKTELKNVLGGEESRGENFKERIGHTPVEVVGGVLFGVGGTVLLWWFFF